MSTDDAHPNNDDAFVSAPAHDAKTRPWPWYKLPRELFLSILEDIRTARDRNLTSCIMVCRTWRTLFEKFNFENLSVEVTNATLWRARCEANNVAAGRLIAAPRSEILLLRDAMDRGERLKWLKTLRIVINFEAPSTRTQEDRLQHDFVKRIDEFFALLKDWEDKATFDLEIREEPSCGHHLAHYGSNLIRTDKARLSIDFPTSNTSRRWIKCVKSIRHVELCYDRCHCCKYRGLLSIICSNMSERLESIKYMFRERNLKDASMNNEKWDFVPPSVKHLSICNVDESGNPPRPDLVLPQSLRNVAVQLETLDVSKFVDAAFLLPALPLNRHISWPSLKFLTLTMFSLCGEGHGDPSVQLALVAEAALQMPNLKKMQLWSAPREGGNDAAGYFRYEVEGEGGRARGYASWRTGWGYQPPYWVLVK